MYVILMFYLCVGNLLLYNQYVFVVVNLFFFMKKIKKGDISEKNLMYSYDN